MDKIDKLNKNNLNISSSAEEQINKILSYEKTGSFVRLSIDSGGCSGFSYNFTIDFNFDSKNDIKLLSNKNKPTFVSDIVSLKFIKSSTIDWKEDLSSSQFVIENPLASARCGCGTSFSI